MNILALINEYFQYNTLGMLYLSSGMFDLSIGIIVLLKDPKSPVNRTFFYITASTFFWVFGYGMLSLTRNINNVLFWCALAFIGVPSIPFSIYLFSVSIIRKLEKNLLNYIGAIGALLFSIIGLLFQERINTIKDFEWGRFNLYKETSFGLIYFWGLVGYFILYLLLAAVQFYRGWKTAIHPVKRKQSKMIFFGFIFSYIGTADFLVTRGFDIYPIGFLACTYLIGTMAYTIVRHQFFDINVVLKRLTLIVVIYSFLLAFSVPIGVLFLNRYFHDLNQNQLYGIIAFGAAFGAILSLGPFIYAGLVRHGYWLKGHLATGLTHELKSPLSVIQSATHVIREELNKPVIDKSKFGDYAEIIERNTNRLDIFVKDLLNVAKIQNNTVEILHDHVNFSELVAQSTEQYKSLVEAKGLQIQTNITPNLFISGDANKLNQIISNLISNAIKFTDHGLIQVEAISEKGFLVCAVKDTGVGIPNQHLARIFDRFFQVKNSGKGSGIGLTIAKAWVEAHGGKIWAESPANTAAGEPANNKAGRDGESLPAGRCGRGTTVRFTLPL